MTPMRNHFKSIVFFLSVVVFCGMSMHAQEPGAGSKDPESLFTTRDPKLNASKQVVMHIMRDLLEAGHWDEAPKYLSARYLQHNPNLASGLRPVLAYFAGSSSKPIPDKNSWTTQVVSVVAEVDYVTVPLRDRCRTPRSDKDVHDNVV
jgi:predicted SnoaL-like aldol condensation-catalyzing enzyme